MPLFQPTAPHRNSYHSGGTDGRERSRVLPNETANLDEARLQHGQRIFSASEFPTEPSRTIAPVSSDLIGKPSSSFL
jgi:hypothetical protein